MVIMRLQRLHLSSSPPPTTLAINCPHSQRVSLFWLQLDWLSFAVIMLPVCPVNEIENDY